MSANIIKIPWLFYKAGLVLASSFALSVLIPFDTSPANAFDLGDGRTVFDHAPRLVRTATTHSATNTPAKYQFTIEVPENAGEALKAVTITPKNNPQKIKFDVSKSKAFIGDSFAGGTPVSLADIGGNLSRDINEVTIVFDEPVQPGNTVTVSLKARRNPSPGGIYLFGVTAFSEGDNSPGLYLGSGRLSFFHN